MVLQGLNGRSVSYLNSRLSRASCDQAGVTKIQVMSRAYNAQQHRPSSYVCFHESFRRDLLAGLLQLRLRQRLRLQRLRLRASPAAPKAENCTVRHDSICLSDLVLTLNNPNVRVCTSMAERPSLLAPCGAGARDSIRLKFVQKRVCSIPWSEGFQSILSSQTNAQAAQLFGSIMVHESAPPLLGGVFLPSFCGLKEV